MAKLGAAEESRRRRRRREIAKKTFSYFFLSTFGISMIIPFLWMISTSLKYPGEVFTFPPEWIPLQEVIEKDGKRLDVIIEKEEVTVEILQGARQGQVVKKPKNQVHRFRPKWWNPFYVQYYIYEEREGKWFEWEEEPSKIQVKPIEQRSTVRVIEDGPYRGDRYVVDSREIGRRLNLCPENYPRAWQAVPFARGYINSAFVAIVVTFGQVFTSSLAAYAFSRFSFPGRDKIFLGYLATLMIPGAVTMIPIFILLKKLPEVLNLIFHTNFWTSNLYLGTIFLGRPIGIDSYFALIAPGLFSAYGTFMLRQFFMTIPRDLEDAALIDGSSLFGIYFRIILPLSKPALATLTIFTFMGSWRNFMWPLIVVNSEELQTLPVMLASFQGLYTTEWTLLMAGSIIVLFPVLVVFILGQRFFVEGIRLGAIKG